MQNPQGSFSSYPHTMIIYLWLDYFLHIFSFLHSEPFNTRKAFIKSVKFNREIPTILCDSSIVCKLNQLTWSLNMQSSENISLNPIKQAILPEACLLWRALLGWIYKCDSLCVHKQTDGHSAHFPVLRAASGRPYEWQSISWEYMLCHFTSSRNN